MPTVDCSQSQCTWVWDSGSSSWEQLTNCPDGCTCAQAPPGPGATGIRGQDGDIWVSLCVARRSKPKDRDKGP
jgi:hypothetical protein